MSKMDGNGQQYICEKCGKVFNHKGHYMNHINKKILVLIIILMKN